MGVSAAWRGKDRSPQNLAGSGAAALITSMIILTPEQWAAVLHNVFEITIMRGGIACRGTAYSSDGQVRGHPEARLTGTIMGFMPVGDCARECPYCRSRLLKHGFKARTIHAGDPKGFSSGGPAFTKSTVLLQIMICKNKECRSHSREADEDDPTRLVEKRGVSPKFCVASQLDPLVRRVNQLQKEILIIREAIAAAPQRLRLMAYSFVLACPKVSLRAGIPQD